VTRNGFTLLELLVALAVFSIAALALLRLDAVAVSTAADLRAKEGSMLVAENEAARLATDPGNPPLGLTSQSLVNGGRTFLVRRSVVRTPDPRLVRIDLFVSEGQGSPGSTLTMVRRVR
jgi:general secretion pathway protein I